MIARKSISALRFGSIFFCFILSTIILQACSPAAPIRETASSVLRIAAQPIVQTDPARISSDSEVLVASHVYDYLVDVSPESKILPRLATDWIISEDGLTFYIVFSANPKGAYKLNAQKVTLTRASR